MDRQLGMELRILADDHSDWSQATFGNDFNRGPIGPLKHLAKEAKEASESPYDVTEYADCLLLILDASRRAGFTPQKLIRAAQEKMVTNRLRQWTRPMEDEPVEHVRDQDEKESQKPVENSRRTRLAWVGLLALILFFLVIEICILVR